MGATIARLLLAQGYRVTVWNRTGAKAEMLAREGAQVASSPAEAVAASALVVVCVHDHKATREILQADGVAAAISGRVLVQMTTTSPQEAKDTEAWAREHGADYLDGAIQVAPDQMAQPDTTILVSGTGEAYQRSEKFLKVLGGNVTYLGENAALAATMDLATLSYVYGAILGFMHGARIGESQGLDLESYGAIVAAMSPGFGEFLKHESGVIRSSNYAVSQSPLKISVEAVDRILKSTHDMGINDGFPVYASRIFRQADADGLGNEELAALIKVLRKPGRSLEQAA
jgi:3-hydroxyisobutyrate dehydrogenase-like beta-hydroxyacid dehydrogenase